MALRVNGGGEGAEVLLLLHGLGGTGDIWGDLAGRWRGRWLAPDLPGHGGSERLDSYSFVSMAAGLQPLLHSADRVTVLGHSLGGVVGLELAHLVPGVRRVVGLGIKVEWSDDELAWARGLAERPVTWFDTEDEAVTRHRKVSGLGDLVDDDIARCGVVEQAGRWRLALDPRAFAVGRPDMRGLLRHVGADVTLARGELDHMVSDSQLAALVHSPVGLPGLGHNAHLEDPAAVFALL